MSKVYQIWYHQWEIIGNKKVRIHSLLSSADTVEKAKDLKRRASHTPWFVFRCGDRLSIRRVK